MNKIGEVFDSKPKNADLPINDVIDEFVDQLTLYNSKFDFKNFLVMTTKQPKENLSLVREYSNFVKFIHKLKLYNHFQEQVIIKSLVIKLIESNSNFVKIKKNFNESTSMFTKDFMSLLQKKVTRALDNEKSSSEIGIASEFKNDNYVNTLFDEKERHTLKYQNMKKILSKFTSLPKLFYKRISMINLQDVYNALQTIKSSDDVVRSSLKIRKDIKEIRKNVAEIVEVLNAKEVLKVHKRSMNINNFNQRRSSYFRNSVFFGAQKENEKKTENSEIFMKIPILQKNKVSAKSKINNKKIEKIQEFPDEKDE
jgi:hypothetical protein